MPALVSILHRISGIIIFLSLPLFLYWLNQSLVSADHFDRLATQLHTPGLKWVLWIVLSAVAYHFFAGVRHLLMDAGLAETLPAGRKSAGLVLIVTGIAVVLLGIWLWL
jgi:succinate dehydrogenase cytochrome b subunit